MREMSQYKTTEYMDGYEEENPIQIHEQELRNVSAACMCLFLILTDLHYYQNNNIT
jgi:hypothetical protein